MKLLFLLITLVAVSNCANIFFFFAFSTYSHRITVWPLIEALASKGHNITFLQAHPNKNPLTKGVREIIISRPTMEANSEGMELLDMKFQYGPWVYALLLVHALPYFSEMVCKDVLENEEIQKYLEETEKVDLVVVDAVFNDCALGFAHKWNAQTVLFGTSTVFEWWSEEFGFPAESNWIATPNIGPSMPLTFFGRVFSSLTHLYFRFLKVAYHYPRIEPLLREKLGIPDMPGLTEIGGNASLVLVNTHFSEEVARSLPPLVVPIGGMHCNDELATVKLPKEMEDFISSSGPDEGFIFVSFGSEVKMSAGPESLRQTFFKAFRKVGIKILWKYDGEKPEDMPENVFTASWVPQQAILAHPKIRLFITHGGLLSMQEALYFSVPMISFPIFAEQAYNADRLAWKKRGFNLDITTVTEEELVTAVKTVVTDKSYKEAVKRASTLFKDRPERPVDTAVWWVEYILRNKEDVDFLRPLSRFQTWFQRRNLDVWAAIFLIVFLGFLIVFLTLKKILSTLCSFLFERKEKSSSRKSQKQRNKIKIT